MLSILIFIAIFVNNVYNYSPIVIDRYSTKGIFSSCEKNENILTGEYAWIHYRGNIRDVYNITSIVNNYRNNSVIINALSNASRFYKRNFTLDDLGYLDCNKLELPKSPDIKLILYSSFEFENVIQGLNIYTCNVTLRIVTNNVSVKWIRLNNTENVNSVSSTSIINGKYKRYSTTGFLFNAPQNIKLCCKIVYGLSELLVYNLTIINSTTVHRNIIV